VHCYSRARLHVAYRVSSKTKKGRPLRACLDVVCPDRSLRLELPAYFAAAVFVTDVASLLGVLATEVVSSPKVLPAAVINSIVSA